MNKLVELHQPHPTHFVLETLSLTKLDKAYTTAPGSMLIKMGISATILEAAETLYYKGVSDHSPLGLSCSVPERQSGTFRISRTWCETAAFKERLEILVEETGLMSMGPLERLQTYNQCIISAARHARDTLLFHDKAGKPSCRDILESISRAVWWNDVRLGKRLLDTTDLAKDIFTIDAGRVRVLDFGYFERLYSFEKLSYLRAQESSLRTQLSGAPLATRKQLKARIQASRRLQTIWWPNSRKLRLVGLRTTTTDGAPVLLSSPEDIQTELISAWQPVYSKRPVDEDAVAKLLGVYKRNCSQHMDFAELELAGLEEYVSFIKHTKPSAAGRNGIPYHGYKALPETSGFILKGVADYLSGCDLPEEGSLLDSFLGDFNEQDVSFAPKGFEKEDGISPSRSALNLRTIFLSNTDNKIIAGAQNRTIRPAVLALTPENQRGFCPGRQFGLNVVFLDTFHRVFNLISGFAEETSAIGDCPILALYDIANAFPTIAHVWLLAVLHAIDVNPRLRTLIRMLYHNTRAYSTGIGTNQFLFFVMAGVRTGCPLSATLFLLAMNPFVYLINTFSDGPKLSKSCLCADDIGSALRALKSLKVQYSIFQLAAKVSMMKLKPAKCYLVVSVSGLSDNLKYAIRQWLVQNIPEWQDFQIVPAAKYLGVFLGVDAASITFREPTHKYFDRVEQVSCSVAPSLGSILRYNERVVTVFSYVSQFVQVPDTKALGALEQRGVHKILKLPPNSLARDFMHNLAPFSPKSPNALLPMCSAALARFAHANEVALRTLQSEALEILGDSTPVGFLGSKRIPAAGCSCVAFLNGLIDALERKDRYSVIPTHAVTQTDIYQCLVARSVPSNPQRNLENKIRKTFANIDFDIANFVFPAGWLPRLVLCVRRVKQQVAFSLLRTFVSGWTTSHRMHEAVVLPCIFGCANEIDSIGHYIFCSPLWHISGAAAACEVPLEFGYRLGIQNPTPEILQLLAIACSVYHNTKTRLKELGGFSVVGQHSAHSIAFECSRTFASHLM